MQDKKQWILRDGSIRERLIVWLNGLEIDQDKPLRVLVEPYKKNRSLAQNSLMWLWLNQMAKTMHVEHGVDCNAEDFKHEMQRKYLGRRCVYKPAGKNDWGGHLKSDIRIIGTSELNTAEFTEFLQQIEAYAASELGITLPHPEDIYYEALGVTHRNTA